MGDAHFSRFYRLERGIIFYACADQKSVDWLIAALHGFQIREGARLKAIQSKHLPKPIKMALRTKDKVTTGPEELLKWIKGSKRRTGGFSTLRMSILAEGSSS